MGPEDLPTPEQVAAGHAFYTRRSLAIYDLAIIGYFSRLAWRSPARRILQHYDAHVSANHLDIGVGTGYFLDRCRFPSPPRLVLMDPNDACLAKAGERVAHRHLGGMSRGGLGSRVWDTRDAYDSVNPEPCVAMRTPHRLKNRRCREVSL